MQISDNIKFQVLLKLGLCTGKDSSDHKGLTFLGIEPSFNYEYISVWGFVSKQCQDDVYKMKHTKFNLKL